MEQIYEVVEIRTEEVIASEIRTIVRQTQRTMLDAAIEIGRRLVEAKELVPHGGWGSWIKDKVHFSQSTANNFMQLYEEYGDRQGTLFWCCVKFPNVWEFELYKGFGAPGSPRRGSGRLREKDRCSKFKR